MIYKPELRAAMRVLRRQLAAETPDAGLRAAANLPTLLPASVYGLYHAMGSELDPTPIRLPARRALPAVTDGDGRMEFRAHAPGDLLTPDWLGIPAPPPSAAVVRPEVIFAPVLAFDRSGGRLGQGGGYYDRLIAALRAEGPVWVIGVAYAGQEVARVPLDPHDQRLDAILTETGYRRVDRET